MRTRLVASIVAATVGLAFWWALTEPLPIPHPVLLAVPVVILFCAGVIAGRLGPVASPVALVFSLLLGSILATQLHQYFAPAPPVSSFGGYIALSFPELAGPLVASLVLGAVGGAIGERLVPGGGR